MPNFALRRTLLALSLAVCAAAPAYAVEAEGGAAPTREPSIPGEFTFEGPLGTYDRAALQRGFQVYKEVCSVCHGLTRVAIRALGESGGPGFSEAEVRALAASYMVPAGPNDRGETTDLDGNPLMREATTADFLPPPYPNEKAARAAFNGAFPPDLSLIVKAREDNAHYLFRLLTGYDQQPPDGSAVPRGQYYNPVFASGFIAMPQPLFDSQVTYADGTPATIAQMAHDVTTFLAWAAEPKMEERKAMGFGVMVFLAGFAALLYFSYRKVWRGQH